MNLYLAALIVTAVSIYILLYMIPVLGKNKKKFIFILVLTIPLSTLVNLLIKSNILFLIIKAYGVTMKMSDWPWSLTLISLLTVSITEELTKIFPLIIKKIKFLKNNILNVYELGLLLGFGFGIGEAVYLGYLFTISQPELAASPLFKPYGFMAERLMAIFIHAYITGIFVHFLFQKKILKGFLIAVLFHSLANLGPMFYQLKVFPDYINMVIPLLSLIIVFISALRIEKKYTFKSTTIEKVFYHR